MWVMFQDIKKIKPKYANQSKFLYLSSILSLKNCCIVILNHGKQNTAQYDCKEKSS